MKKLVLPAVALSLIATTPALAKTEGSQIGVDFLSVKTSYRQRSHVKTSGIWREAVPTQSGSTFGAGLRYSYAFNLNGFFIAPGVIFEQDSFGASTHGDNKDRVQTKRRYGAKIDVGYDIADVVSPYATAGFARVSYKTRGNGYDGSGKLVTADRSGFAATPFFGGGLRIALAKNIAMNVEYNYQKFTTQNAIPSDVTYLNKQTTRTKIDVVKVGFSYNF